jgi:hypothetical protein
MYLAPPRQPADSSIDAGQCYDRGWRAMSIDADRRQTMTIRRLEHSELGGFCILASESCSASRWKSRLLAADRVSARGAPLAAAWHRVRLGERRTELLVGDLDHLIGAPRELYVDEELLDIVSFQIVDADGVRQIITLRDPLMLPGPHAIPE